MRVPSLEIGRESIHVVKLSGTRKPRKVEDSSKPADDRDKVESFDVEHSGTDVERTGDHGTLSGEAGRLIG